MSIYLKSNCNILFVWNSPSVLMVNREQERQCGCLCVHACASERVCILFMARNQLSLAHNGNVNSPERLSPTQGENWLGAGCIFPNPNTEREFAGLKSCLLSSPSPERFTALPIHYSNRSSKQVSVAVRKHIRTHMCTHVTHTAGCVNAHLQVQRKGCVMLHIL